MTCYRRVTLLVLLVAWLAIGGCKLLAPGSAAKQAPTQEPASTEELAVPQPAKTEVAPGVPMPAPPLARATEDPVWLQVPLAGDPEIALLPAEGSASELITPARYRLLLNIDPGRERFSGQAVVDVTNTETTSLDRLYFRLLPNGGKSYGSGSLKVTQVATGGQILSGSLSLADSVLEVLLPAALSPGEQVSLEMSFDGRAPADFGGGYGIYSYTNDVMALSGWYPVLAVYDDDGWNLDPVSALGDSVYSDTAYYSVRVCAPSDWLMAATGTASAPAADGCTDYESGPTRDFFLVASQDFKVTEAQEQGVIVRSYYRPGHDIAGQQTLQVAVDALRVFNQRFGPYPFNELEVVEAPMQDALGVEFPGVVLIAEELYEESENSSFPMTIAHEVAHQWWYSVIGNDVFDEPWLDEGLTTYSSIVYFEDIDGKRRAQEYLDYWEQRWNELRQQGDDDVITEDLAYFEGINHPRVYSNVVYMKSALFYAALRDEIGDQAFFSALQHYYRTNRFEIATAKDLLDAFESAAGRSLGELYQKWLYSRQTR